MDEKEVFYRAMLSRDYRFDGKFFIGVKTTGIYCRPICPAKPKFENVEFFPDAFSAEKAGYRPCLRCHPEYSPETISWPGKSLIVQKALALISENVMFEMDVETFAKKLNVSARHLRRVFKEELGLSPKQVSDTHRLNFAYKLTNETHLPLTEVALASGFDSLRRFNDAFKKRYGHPPKLARKSKGSNEETTFNLYISYRPPFDWDSLLHYYSRHQIPYLETVTGNAYERVFKAKGKLGVIMVKHNAVKNQIHLKVHSQDSTVLFTLVNHVKNMFDLNSDPLLISNHFSENPFLDGLWKEFPGLRIARGWDPFEIAIGTILGQVVSVEQATRLMKALMENYGEKIKHPLTNETCYLFPTPEVLAKASLDEIKTTSQRKEAIKELSLALVENRISFKEREHLEAVKKSLQAIKGIGNWSCEYIALRAFGDTNAFPKDDLILKRALTLKKGSFDLSKIQPWRGYLAIYLWKKYAHSLSKQKGKTHEI